LRSPAGIKCGDEGEVALLKSVRRSLSALSSSKATKVLVAILAVGFVIGVAAPPFGYIHHMIRIHAYNQVIGWLEQNYDYGKVAYDVDYIKEKSSIPGSRFVYSERDESNTNLPIFCMENDIRYAVVSRDSWIVGEWEKYKGWITRVQTSYGIGLFEIDLSEWKKIATIVNGETILSDLSEINYLAGRSVSSWIAEDYGWDKEKILLEEEISIVAIYSSKDTSTDEMFAGVNKPAYLTKIAEVDMGYPVSLYRVNMGLLLSSWGTGRQILNEAMESLKESYVTGNIV